MNPINQGDHGLCIKTSLTCPNRSALEKEANKPDLVASRYPYDYGFVENTLSLDGDPLDALVMLEIGLGTS